MKLGVTWRGRNATYTVGYLINNEFVQVERQFRRVKQAAERVAQRAAEKKSSDNKEFIVDDAPVANR